MSFLEKIYLAHQSPKTYCPVWRKLSALANLLQFLFPELNDKRLNSRLAVEAHFKMLNLEFENLLHKTEACEKAGVRSVCKHFFKDLETVYELCLEDSKAILLGDPAAVDAREVIRSYRGFYAIAVYRIAHLLLTLQVPYLPDFY
ncbi:MAG: hypothetical protein R2788_20360 [Saprospiraceae bacterium]